LKRRYKGVYFAVWAPSAASVSVVGDFNYWTGGENLLQVRWDPQVFGRLWPNIGLRTIYKYKIASSIDGVITEKQILLVFTVKAPPHYLGSLGLRK
jgi:1,4-alpha-glucan branching enzyme